MLFLVGSVVVLAVVYAIKAVVISRTYDELAVNSASFSWASAREQDQLTAQSWAAEEEPVADQHVAFGSLRPVGGARA